MNRAGLPATTTPAMMGLETTEPAATVANRPTSAITSAPSPIQAPSPISTCRSRRMSVGARNPSAVSSWRPDPLMMPARLPIRQPRRRQDDPTIAYGQMYTASSTIAARCEKSAPKPTKKVPLHRSSVSR